MTSRSDIILSIHDLVVRFDTRRGPLTAVGGVSFDLARGETLGIVGESGCGKSTLGRAIIRLVEPAAGTVSLDGAELTGRSRRSLRTARRDIQMVFQDPLASLDARWTVGDLIAEPLVIHGIGTRAARKAKVSELIAKVGLQPDAIGRHPHAFSGGQRQRIAIARALALEPKIVVLDEPVSALDVSVQAQILNLLLDLQETLGVAFLFISHDLSVVEHISDRVAVMYLGRIVEIGDRATLFRQPAPPYTRALLDAVPRIGRGKPSKLVQIASEIPSPYAPPSGCPYRARCPLAVARCAEEIPVLRTAPAGQSVACHLA